MGIHTIQQTNRCGSPSEHSNSAPPSPSPLGNQAMSPASSSGGQSIPGRSLVDSDKCLNQGFHANVLQQEFEQFKMVSDFAGGGGDCEGTQMVCQTFAVDDLGSKLTFLILLRFTYITNVQIQGTTGHSSSSSASSSTGVLYMNSVIVHDKDSGDNYYTGGGNGQIGFAPRNLPLSASGLTSSSVPSLYTTKSVISCPPSQYHMACQATHSSNPQTPNSIPNIEITGMFFVC